MSGSMDEEDYDCPLCMEELDIADRSFRPCPCGYQICRFCWHHIKENLNGRCPACRGEYIDQMIEFQPVSAEEVTRIKRERKEKERQQKDMEAVNRRHLANMRVVQKNLVYVIGLHPKLATEETIRSQEFFGQFGKIAKVVINKRPGPTSGASASSSSSVQASAAVYVTYYRKEDATKAIHAVDGNTVSNRILRASFGTTKYCTYYLRNMSCPNPSCLYLHEPGEEADMISKEELATGKHRMRDQLSTDDERDQATPTSIPSSRKPATLDTVATAPCRTTSTKQHISPVDSDRPALPITASWGKLGSSTPSTPVLTNASSERSLTPDSFGPPLSATLSATASPSVGPKPKVDKKKRKELTRTEEAMRQIRDDAVIQFVLGDEFQRQRTLQDEDDRDVSLPESVAATLSSLSLSSSSTAQSSTESSAATLEQLSAFDFLMSQPRRPPYMGSFNPFVHQPTHFSLFDAPLRKTSRFGFAQV